MAIWVRIDNEEDYYYLRSLMRRAVERAQLQPATMPEDVVEHSQRLHEALTRATKDDVPVEVQVEMPPEPLKERKPRAPRGSKKVDVRLALCKAHPNYKALRSPRTNCEGCWAAYEKYKGVAFAKAARAKFDRVQAKSS